MANATLQSEGRDDALSDVLRLIKLDGSVYFVADFAAPWGMAMEKGPFAQFHVVVRGSCWLRMGDQTYLMEKGDIALLPHGSAHALLDDPAGNTQSGPEVLGRIMAGNPPFPPGGAPTRLLCGHFAFERDLRHPLVTDLPDLVRVRAMAENTPGWLEVVSSLLAAETAASLPGAETLVDRLAEVLLIQVLRAYLASERPGGGFLAAAADPQLSRALRLIHTCFDEDLTLYRLARASGMSRSNFASHFHACVGLPPIGYLMRWRMAVARVMLSKPGATVAAVAEKTGYRSEAAFSRMFKRVHDIPPGALKRQ